MFDNHVYTLLNVEWDKIFGDEIEEQLLIDVQNLCASLIDPFGDPVALFNITSVKRYYLEEDNTTDSKRKVLSTLIKFMEDRGVDYLIIHN